MEDMQLLKIISRRYQTTKAADHRPREELKRRKIVFERPLVELAEIGGNTKLASLVAQLVKNPPAMRETGFKPRVGKSPWRRERLSTPVILPREFHGLYSPQSRKESDMTDFHFTSLSWQESYDQPRQHIKKQRHYFANRGPSHQGYGFSSGHVWM